MGWVEMSERELRRAEVLASVFAGRLTMTAAAGLMGITRRQAHRLARLFVDQGAAGLRHRARGRPSNRGLGPHVRQLAIAYVTENYRDFGPTLASQMLLERHGLRVSRETLRTWMREEGLWLSRKQRRQLHQPRLRRDHFGELVQIDGSEHRWFEERGPRCTLIVFIDDATSRLVALRFVPSESAFAYFETLKSYLISHGRPLAFYSDKHSIFRVSKAQAQGGQGLTQFGRALSELGIEILYANSSQAKGRVERVNRTLQDRLVKELRLEGIATLEAANAYLPGFVARFNERFAIAPARSEDWHRPLERGPAQLDAILAWREQRYVTQQLALSYDRKRIILDETPLSVGLAGQYVETYEFPDGRLEVRWQGIALSGLDGIQNKVRALGYGADDYLTKPFHKDELIARMQAIIRRSSDQSEAVLQCGDLTVKPQAQKAEVGGRPVNLTSTEYKILAFLTQRQGSTLTKEMLLNHLYSGMDEPEIKIIDVFICKLRKKLAEASGGRNYIETVWGRGYMLREPHGVKLAS